ncbi:MAG: hypothetical protein H0V08_02860 [Thermoleophilaceae bacterium]|nr:hypothetical protein [Thermoleophilaceae bacterium]
MTFPAVGVEEVPWITVEQMREVDRVAIAIGLDLTRMMENAGASLSFLARALLGATCAAARSPCSPARAGTAGAVWWRRGASMQRLQRRALPAPSALAV